jgi:hypothetical protein
MERRLPPQYAGWEQHQEALRALTTPQLIAEVQDGPPDRRLAALSAIDLSAVDRAQIEDWIRVLPDAEVNELAGAISLQRARPSCHDDLRWAEVARLGYERRHLPTFLVVLFSSLEGLEAAECPQADKAWRDTGAWLRDVYDQLSRAGDGPALEDVSLFVFENYLDRDAIFSAFCDAVLSHEELAKQVSANPSLLLSGLPEQRQRHALQEAETGGGLPLRESWAALHGF